MTPRPILGPKEGFKIDYVSTFGNIFEIFSKTIALQFILTIMRTFSDSDISKLLKLGFQYHFWGPQRGTMLNILRENILKSSPQKPLHLLCQYVYHSW